MSDAFVRALSKVVVAQLCKEMGFAGIQQSACEALVDILQKYIEQLGMTSHSYSEHACRTESNFHDVRQSLLDVGVKLEDLYNFATKSGELPFAFAVPEFPLKSTIEHNAAPSSSTLVSSGPSSSVDSSRLTSSTNGEFDTHNNNSNNPPYIPECLPPLPDPHTYKDSPVYPQRPAAIDPRQFRKKKAKEKRESENSLAILNEKLGSKPIINYDQARKIKGNPYFALPEEPNSMQHHDGIHSNQESTATTVPLTPLSKESPFVKTVLVTKQTIAKEEAQHKEQEKRQYTDVEAAERDKKRSRAEQIFSMKDVDAVDS